MGLTGHIPGDWVTFAEVLYEAMEFETSSFVHGMMEE